MSIVRTAPLLLLLTGCAGGIRVLTPGCDVEPSEMEERCADEPLEAMPGEAVALAFEAYAYGSYAGTYGIEPNVTFDTEVTLSTDSVAPDDTLEPVTLSFTVPADACGSGFAGIDMVDEDGEIAATGSVTVSLVNADGSLLFCGQ